MSDLKGFAGIWLFDYIIGNISKKNFFYSICYFMLMKLPFNWNNACDTWWGIHNMLYLYFYFCMFYVFYYTLKIHVKTTRPHFFQGIYMQVSIHMLLLYESQITKYQNFHCTEVTFTHKEGNNWVWCEVL